MCYLGAHEAQPQERKLRVHNNDTIWYTISLFVRGKPVATIRRGRGRGRGKIRNNDNVYAHIKYIQQPRVTCGGTPRPMVTSRIGACLSWMQGWLVSTWSATIGPCVPQTEMHIGVLNSYYKTTQVQEFRMPFKFCWLSWIVSSCVIISSNVGRRSGFRCQQSWRSLQAKIENKVLSGIQVKILFTPNQKVLKTFTQPLCNTWGYRFKTKVASFTK